MNIFERTRSQWSKLFSTDDPQQKAASPQGAPPEDDGYLSTFEKMVKDWGRLFERGKDRKERLNDFDVMDVGDIAVMLDATVDTSTIFEEDESSDDPLLRPESFKIIFPSNYATSKARKTIEQVLEDTGIRDELSVYARDMLKYGDAFMEIIPDANDDTLIRRILHKSVEEINVNRDNKGRLRLDIDEHGNPMAYQQFDSAGRVLAGWFPNEMVHFKLYPDSKETYSKKGLLDDIRDDWRKLTWVEQGMVIARVIRAYPRVLHTLDVTGKTTVEATKILQQYIRNTSQKAVNTTKKAPMSVDEDYYLASGYHTQQDGKMVPKVNSVQVLDPQINGLGMVGDIQHMRRKVFNKVPGEVVGIMDNASQELTSQDISYARFVKKLQFRMEKGIRQLVDTALKLEGLEGINYRIVWPRVIVGTSWKFADAKFRITMADRNKLEMGTRSPQEILREEGKSEEDITRIIEEWKSWQQVITQVAVDQAKQMGDVQVGIAKKMPVNKTVPGQDNPTGTGAQGGKTGAGNQAKRTATKTIPTKGGQGQAAQGAMSGG